MNSQIQSALEWRYATKLFNPEKKISDADLNLLLEAVRLAPSSFGLQPWKVYVVTNKEVREKLKAAAWNQPQVTNASHVLVFAARKNMDEAYVNSYINDIVQTRGQKEADLQVYKKMILGSASALTPEQIQVWNSRQPYIALGMLLETAALMKIDACPMEGFDKTKFDTILGLDKTDYTSVVMATVGYRSDTDIHASEKKVRFASKDIFVHV